MRKVVPAVVDCSSSKSTTMRFINTILPLLMTVSLSMSAQEIPNIVLINMDNFGYGELGCYGGGITRGAPTPRIDKLASEGMRLSLIHI